GISGDMFLAALIDSGIQVIELQHTLREIGISPHEVVVNKTIKKGVTATSIMVNPDPDRHHLHVEDIQRMIGSCGLGDRIITRASKAFETIIMAESQVHGVSPELVHLHEVSGLDTVVDLIGVAWAIDHLGIERVYSTPLNVGSGMVRIAHGVVPIPAPATALILNGIPIVDDGLPGERTTPTGAALAAVCVDRFASPGKMIPETIGYGAGSLDSGDRANVMRIVIGRSLEDDDQNETSTEELTMLETDIDDDTPEMMGHVMDRLIDRAEVLDAVIVPVLRKKGRPGYLIRVLVRSEAISAIVALLFSETATLGVRESKVNRHTLQRKSVPIETPYGTIHVIYAGNTRSPEFADCRAAALKHGVPLKEVVRAVLKSC
ncbi:nickel pincer cofactor biosynthesis protein LarC, partial [bacterium]|nr:nickel pincer cofactor biosynthesis protein LarC [candidate division CSSED10-310 bacterium]